MKFEVPIIYRGQSNYIVNARNKKHAEELALSKFYDGDDGVILGNEWESVEKIGKITKILNE